MKVRVTLTVGIDDWRAWGNYYGAEFETAQATRDDIREYVAQTVAMSAPFADGVATLDAR